jgi:sugar phosphate isomerase/epimerase
MRRGIVAIEPSRDSAGAAGNDGAMPSIDRRSFLQGAAALGLCSLSGCAGARRTQPWFSISLAQWSLHRTLRGEQGERLDPLDFAHAARGFGIDGIEYVNSFFKDKARDKTYLAELKARAAGEGVQSLLIMCDGEGNLGDPDAARRAGAVENHQRWVEAAQFLGCHSIRVNAASAGSPDEQRRLAADGLRRLSEFADGAGLNVIVENHGGLSSDGAWLAATIREADHPRCGTLPDFGNFGSYDRYKGVAELMPFARAVSAKSYDFDDAGNETTIDYARMLRIVRDAGYRGWVGIEYEGKRLSEPDGILATRRLLERVRAELA